MNPLVASILALLEAAMGVAPELADAIRAWKADATDTSQPVAAAVKATLDKAMGGLEKAGG